MKTCTRAVCRASALTAALFIGLTLRSQGATAGFLSRWTTNQVSNVVQMYSVVYSNKRFIAFGWYYEYRGIFDSEDGKNWTYRVDGQQSSGFSWGDLCYAGNRFFALGTFGASAFSTNGLDWTFFTLAGGLLFRFPLGAGVASIERIPLVDQ